VNLQERIIDAATREFLERGFTEATTRAIARRAKTSESSIFRYFDSKYDLLAAILQNGWRTLSEHVMPDVDAAVTPSEGLRVLGRKMLQFYQQSPDIGRLLLSEGRVSGSASIASNRSVATAFLSEETQKFVGHIDQLIEQGQRAGEIINSLAPTAVREGFFGLVEGLAFGWYLSAHTAYDASYSLEGACQIIDRFIVGLTNINSQ
jgi:AcrR family transcriptional regulator